MDGKPDARGEGQGSGGAVDNGVGEVRPQIRVVAAYFKTCFAVDQQHQFPAQGEEGDRRMRPEATFARDGHTRAWTML